MSRSPLPLSLNPGSEFTSSPLVIRVFGSPQFHTEGEVAALAFATDGTLWSIDECGLLWHWSPDGQPLSRTFLSDLETLWRFSPDARFLASANDDLHLWDVGEGQLLKRLEQPSWITALAFHPDGKTLATGHDNGRLRVWDLASQRLVGEIVAHPEAISAVAYAPSGEWLATAGEDRVVRLWNAESHGLMRSYTSHTDRIPDLCWSCDSRFLYSAGWDTSVRVWDVSSPSSDPVILLNSHSDQVMTLASSPVSSLLVTADSDHEIRCWPEPVVGRFGHVFRGHSDEIRCLAFRRDGRVLASAGAEARIFLWDVQTGQCLSGLEPPGKGNLAFLNLPSGLQVASTSNGRLQLWDTVTGELDPLSGISATCVAASSDGRFLAVGNHSTEIRVYDRRYPERQPHRYQATQPPIGSLAFSPSGAFLVHTSPSDGLVWLWNPNDPEADAFLILIEAADGCTLEAVAIHPDNRQVAIGGIDYLSTGNRDGAVCLWDVVSKQKIVTFDQGVTALAFDATGRFLAGAGLSRRVYLWDMATGEQIFDLEGHSDGIYTVTFSPDGSYLLSGGDDQIIRVWDVLSGRLLAARALDSVIHALAFSPDGCSLYVALNNGTCQQLDWKRFVEE
jgi:WD40 repeat protein